MKVRCGYVSNSSSSSFLVMYKNNVSLNFFKDDGKNSTVLAQFTFDDFLKLVDHFNNWASDSTQVVADGLEEVKSYFADEDADYRYEEDHVKEKLEKLEANVKDYPNAAILRISYDNEMISKLLEGFIATGSVIQLDDQEC